MHSMTRYSEVLCCVVLCCVVLCCVVLYCVVLCCIVLFYPMFADFEFSVFDIVTTILNSPQYALKSREMYIQAFKYMRHFGLDRKIAIDGQ